MVLVPVALPSECCAGVWVMDCPRRSDTGVMAKVLACYRPWTSYP